MIFCLILWVGGPPPNPPFLFVFSHCFCISQQFFSVADFVLFILFLLFSFLILEKKNKATPLDKKKIKSKQHKSSNNNNNHQKKPELNKKPKKQPEIIVKTKFQQI